MAGEMTKNYAFSVLARKRRLTSSNKNGTTTGKTSAKIEYNFQEREICRIIKMWAK